MLSGAYLHGPQHGLIERACARGPPAPCASRSSGPPSSYGRRGPPARDEQEPRRRDWGEERERERDWGREQDQGARRPFSEQQQQQLLQRQREGPPRGQREWGGEEAAGSWRDGPRGYNERGSAGGGRGGGGRGKREEAARKAARLADKAAEAQRRSQGCCYGCGATLQTEVPGGPGYVAPAKYQVKKQRKQLDKVLCGRCSELCNGAMIPAVQDFTQKLQLRLEQQQQQEQVTAAGAKEQAVSGAAVASAAVAAPPDVSAQGAAEVPGEALSLLGKALVTPEQLRAQLTQLSLRAAVVVLLVDLLDASGTLMGRVRDMVGRNPIVLVGTKMDLLPEGTRPRDVAEWLSGAAASKRLNVVSVHLVSAHTGEGMSAAVARICRERKSRDVFVVGAANVGKSAFVRAMLKELARTEPVAIGTGRYLPVESAMPGTTLGLIPLQAFSAGGTLYDTPGVHLHHRIPHMLAPHELKLLHPRRRLAVMVPPPPADLSYDNDDEYDSDDEDAPYGSDDDDEPGIDAWDDLEVDEREGKGQKGAVGGGEQAGERLGRGGLRIVTHDPVDDYGMPMTGLDAGIRKVQPAGRGGKAAPPPASAAAGGASGSGKQVQAQGQQQRVLAREAKAQARGQGRAVRGTYMWSDLVRVDVLSGPPSTALVFYGPPATRVVGLPYIPPSQKLEVDYTGDSESPSGSSSSSTNVLVATQSVAARGGLQAHDLVVRASGAGGGGGGGAVADVAVSGLPGWVAVWAPRAKTDVRLRVWAPRGVEVMLRTPLPLPPPPALLRAWRGETAAAGGGAAADDETPAALDEWAGALAQSMNDPTSDPSWWEAMAALKEEDLRPDLLSTSGIRTTTTTTSARKGAKAAPARPGLRGAAGAAAAGVSATAAAAAGAAMGAKGPKRQEQQEEEDNAWGDGEEDLPDWDDEEEMDGDGDDGRTVVVSATVEDILRRPRLDVLSQMDLEEEWDALEDEDEDLDGWGDGGEEDGEEGPRKRGQGGAGKGASGPARDGAWDPLAFGGGDLLAEGGAVAAAAAAGASRRRGAAGSSSSSKGRRARADVEVEAEVEVEEEDDEEVRRPVLRRGAGGVRRRALGRRRAVVVQQVKEEVGEGDQ